MNDPAHISRISITTTTVPVLTCAGCGLRQTLRAGPDRSESQRRRHQRSPERIQIPAGSQRLSKKPERLNKDLVIIGASCTRVHVLYGSLWHEACRRDPDFDRVRVILSTTEMFDQRSGFAGIFYGYLVLVILMAGEFLF